MAFGSGRAGVLKVDDSGGGSLTDISGYCDNVKLTTDQGTYDSTVLGLTSRTFINGLFGWTLEVSGKWDPTLDGYFETVDSASRSVELYPAGTPVGPTKPKLSGEVLKTKYDLSDPVDGIVPFTLTLQGTGALTRATS